jgi:hypothetical protein
MEGVGLSKYVPRQTARYTSVKTASAESNGRGEPCWTAQFALRSQCEAVCDTR